jgi:hypothetical protein
VKPLADVGAARIGDLVAAGLAQVVFAAAALHAATFLTALALAVSVLAAWVAVRMNAGYVRSLERGLRSRAIELDLSEVRDGTTRAIFMKTLGPMDLSRLLPSSERKGTESIALLGRDDAARDAIDALRQAGPQIVEPLVTALLDPSEDFAVRRRIPLVLATYRTPRAFEGLSRGLADRRFEVRYRCGRGLSHLSELEPSFRIAPRLVTEAVLREVEVGAGVWEGRRILDRMDDEGWSPVVDDAIRERADRSLEHVFTLLALVLPRQPLRIAFRGLHVRDPFLRGTALEYLESALPPEIRKPLWPFLEDRRPRGAPTVKPTEEALADLLKQNESIVIQLDELRRGGRKP